MKVHRRAFSHIWTAECEFTADGRWRPRIGTGAPLQWRWSGVTCKRCLKHRPIRSPK